VDAVGTGGEKFVGEREPCPDGRAALGAQLPDRGLRLGPVLVRRLQQSARSGVDVVGQVGAAMIPNQTPSRCSRWRRRCVLRGPHAWPAGSFIERTCR